MSDPIYIYRSTVLEVIGLPNTPSGDWVRITVGGQAPVALPWSEFTSMVAEAARKLALAGPKDPVPPKTGIGAGEDF